ncbi:MAG: hypothetical protein QXI60_09435 [Thermofilaceae archaeon]
MKNWTRMIKTAIRLYKWRLLTLILALTILIISKNYAIATETVEPPPGSAPAPDIDPL